MASNPLIQQGTLNRLINAVLFASSPELNVTPSYMMPEGSSIALDGAIADMLPTQTGLVVSPAPYQHGRVTIHMIHSQALAAAFKSRIESNAQVGNVTVKTDSIEFPDYNLINCAITDLKELSFSGKDPSFIITVTGIYYINQSLWG